MNQQAAQRAGRIGFALVRVPLGAVDERIVQRFLSRDSAVRQSFEHLLDAVDDAASRWLADPVDQPHDAGSPAQEPSADVEEEQIEDLTDELLEQEETETFAGELADDDELRRVQAELNAKRLVEEQREEGR